MKGKIRNISIVQIMPMGECYIQLTDENGVVCSNEEYEDFLFGMGAEMIHKY